MTTILKKTDLERIKAKGKLTKRHERQLNRLSSSGTNTESIQKAVAGTIQNLDRGAALVIYGEPQSGKTEMMICLTAKLLDLGYPFIVHLMNDSVDLLTQNLKRFKASGLAPAPRNSSEFLLSAVDRKPQELVVFCKKNARDLEKLITRIADLSRLVVIDDEADYATPNSKVNQGKKTSINALIESLIGKGSYIGVTATPARLDLNNTFKNDTQTWVNFPPHPHYTGQDVFFPIDKRVGYKLTLLDQAGDATQAKKALIRFLVTVAYLNVIENKVEVNYTMLVHTSGKKDDHASDRIAIEDAVEGLIAVDGKLFEPIVREVHATCKSLFPTENPEQLTAYVVANASRSALVVLNSERDRTAAGDSATEPSTPFTIIIGGNIVSRGVTFPNLLSMYFTRNVSSKLQQDTYIQRARMFGARNSYLKHFELTIPAQLYSDWHRCFVFHRLALLTVNSSGLGSPVWIGDTRISVASKPSVDKATVMLDKGEMSFGIFDMKDYLDSVVAGAPTSVETLHALRRRLGNDALPEFLIDYITTMIQSGSGSLAIHESSSIANYGSSADQSSISRAKGFMGKPQLEEARFPTADHHVKVFSNAAGKGKVFYKYKEKVQFIQNLR